MNFAEARSLAIQGHRVRAVDMQPGAFIYYDFAGLRIDVGGNSSGWSPRPHDEEVEWEDVPIPKPEPKLYLDGKRLEVKDVIVIAPTSIFPMGDTPLGQAVARPDPAPANVGKWGTGAVPKRDAWGRPTD